MSDVDTDRVIWIRIYGVPCQTRCSDLFVSLENSLGSFICLDENTTNKSCMDITRMMIKVSATFSPNEEYLVNIDGMIFSLIIREDSYGPMRIVRLKEENNNNFSTHSSSEDSWSNFGEDDIEGEEEKLEEEELVLPDGAASGKPRFKDTNVRLKDVSTSFVVWNSELEEVGWQASRKGNFSVSFDKEIEKVKDHVSLGEGNGGLNICSKDNNERDDLTNSEGTTVSCSLGIRGITSKGNCRLVDKGKSREKRLKHKNISDCYRLRKEVEARPKNFEGETLLL